MFTASQVTTLEDRNVNITTFRVSRRRRESREMYIGHSRLSVCLSVCSSPHAHTAARTRMSLGGMVGVSLVVHYWADLQWVHGFVAVTA